MFAVVKNETNIKAAVKGLYKLPTIPDLLGRLFSVAGDANSSPQDLYRVISHDKALAERILRVANSVYFGHSGEVREIKQAVMFLGYERVKALALSMTAMEILPSPSSFNLKNLWVHSYEVAFISAALSDVIPMTNPRECFLAGLLHDIGRIVLYLLDSEVFIKVKTNNRVSEEEKAIFGCSHAEAGAWFTEEANLPYEIVMPIMYHHNPTVAEGCKDVIRIVSLAESLSARFSPKSECDGVWTHEHDVIQSKYSLHEDDIIRIREKFYDGQPGIKNFFG